MSRKAGYDLIRRISTARLRDLCLIVDTGNHLRFLNESYFVKNSVLKKMSVSEFWRTLLLKDCSKLCFTWEPIRNANSQPPSLPSPPPALLPEPLILNLQNSKSPHIIRVLIKLGEAPVQNMVEEGD